MAATSHIEWRYDTDSSWLLRLIAHGFVAGLGGSLLLVGGAMLVSLPATLPQLDIGLLVLIALLLLVGGPFSLLYLWPMLTDADQRPEPAAFSGREGAMPWTKRSVAAAAVTGAVLLGGLAMVGVSFEILYLLVVLAIFSPVLVSLFSTEGAIEDNHLVCNGTSVPLRRVTNVRSLRIGNAVVFWISYARGTGLLSPRLVTVPVETAPAVRDALENVKRQSSERGTGPPDRVVQMIVVMAGLLFLGVAFLAAWATNDPVVRIYFGGILGLIGALLCIAGWRGV